MSKTFSAKALRGHTLHTPKGFIVFNAGETVKNIPEDYRQRLERDGVIAAGKAPAAAKTSAAGGDDDGVDKSTFVATYKPVGKYEITGPGLDEPLVIEGNKADAAAKIAELEAAAGGDDDGAPTE